MDQDGRLSEAHRSTGVGKGVSGCGVPLEVVLCSAGCAMGQAALVDGLSPLEMCRKVQI